MAAHALEAKATAKIQQLMHALGVTHLRVDGFCLASAPEAAEAWEEKLRK